MSTSGGEPAGALSVATEHLDATAIGTLFSLPWELVTKPGANRALEVVAAAYEFVTGTDGFTSDDKFSPVIVMGNAPTADLAVNNAGILLDGTVAPRSCFAFGLPQRSASPALPTSDLANKALYVGQLTADPGRAGPIDLVALAAPGLGYAPGDTGTINTDPLGYVGGAPYVIDTVGALGVVLTFHLTGAGDGYSTRSNPLPTTNGGAQPGVGAGFTVNVTSISPADGDLYVTILYKTITTH